MTLEDNAIPTAPAEVPLRPSTVQEAVLARLRKLLLTGELKPGQRIKQGGLAQQLGVSPVPVREALQVLQSEGLVTYQSGRGFWVTELSSKDVEEIDLLARLLEYEAFRRGVPRLTDNDIARMEQLYEELEATAGSDDTWRQIQLHRELHFVPVSAAQLPRLTTELTRYWEHTDHHRVLYVFKHPASSKVSLRQHADIIEACRTRDPARVIEVQDAHRDYALRNILESVRSSQGS